MIPSEPPGAGPALAETVRGLQERAARALPAEVVEHADGWWLRHDSGSSWWVASVLPHGPDGPGGPGTSAATAGLARRVARAEEFYARHGGTARFQITPDACPAGLDALLAGRGYDRSHPVSLQAAAVAEIPGQRAGGPLRVRIEDRPVDAWFGVWLAVRGEGAGAAAWGLLDRVAGPSAYARVLHGDETVAVGRAVADSGWAGVFAMATLPAARGRGAGGRVLGALAEWAGAHGATGLYLQVERDNPAALRLYARAGFREVCTYHYRTAGAKP
ncbi:GNAT family acetyltransferase [Streptomyces sp. CNQ-509]|uniref:GNAT family N-acetyltransferase n=1 Tax=Streptomyces sp. CNQ-509 TaxID=444103 RepID=UPI00062DFB20|nr:GNAT family N-acetyltransferase [Streptomyces sp. CNQ-509]AKH86267.1 GNAT family acetyltransferase [Streptomyces sp. CNQ-509]